MERSLTRPRGQYDRIDAVQLLLVLDEQCVGEDGTRIGFSRAAGWTVAEIGGNLGS